MSFFLFIVSSPADLGRTSGMILCAFLGEFHKLSSACGRALRAARVSAASVSCCRGEDRVLPGSPRWLYFAVLHQKFGFCGFPCISQWGFDGKGERLPEEGSLEGAYQAAGTPAGNSYGPPRSLLVTLCGKQSSLWSQKLQTPDLSSGRRDRCVITELPVFSDRACQERWL